MIQSTNHAQHHSTKLLTVDVSDKAGTFRCKHRTTSVQHSFASYASDEMTDKN